MLLRVKGLELCLIEYFGSLLSIGPFKAHSYFIVSLLDVLDTRLHSLLKIKVISDTLTLHLRPVSLFITL